VNDEVMEIHYYKAELLSREAFFLVEERNLWYVDFDTPKLKGCQRIGVRGQLSALFGISKKDQIKFTTSLTTEDGASPELEKAVELGYQVLHVYEVWPSVLDVSLQSSTHSRSQVLLRHYMPREPHVQKRRSRIAC